MASPLSAVARPAAPVAVAPPSLDAPAGTAVVLPGHEFALPGAVAPAIKLRHREAAAAPARPSLSSA